MSTHISSVIVGSRIPNTTPRAPCPVDVVEDPQGPAQLSTVQGRAGTDEGRDNIKPEMQQPAPNESVSDHQLPVTNTFPPLELEATAGNIPRPEPPQLDTDQALEAMSAEANRIHDGPQFPAVRIESSEPTPVVVSSSAEVPPQEGPVPTLHQVVDVKPHRRITYALDAEGNLMSHNVAKAFANMNIEYIMSQFVFPKNSHLAAIMSVLWIIFKRLRRSGWWSVAATGLGVLAWCVIRTLLVQRSLGIPLWCKTFSYKSIEHHQIDVADSADRIDADNRNSAERLVNLRTSAAPADVEHTVRKLLIMVYHTHDKDGYPEDMYMPVVPWERKRQKYVANMANVRDAIGRIARVTTSTDTYVQRLVERGTDINAVANDLDTTSFGDHALAMCLLKEKQSQHLSNF